MTTINAQVLQLAQQDAQATGLDEDVILAQWMAEEPITGKTVEWPGNNPAGISPGDSEVDALSNGKTSGGFLSFASPSIGAKAYADMINDDPNYSGIRAAIQKADTLSASQKAGGEAAELEMQAIAASPWDNGHYTASGGAQGSKLFENYASLTDTPIVPIGQKIESGVGNAVKTATVNATESAIDGMLGLQPGEAIPWTRILVVVGGVVLILILLYRTVTK